MKLSVAIALISATQASSPIETRLAQLSAGFDSTGVVVTIGEDVKELADWLGFSENTYFNQADGSKNDLWSYFNSLLGGQGEIDDQINDTTGVTMGHLGGAG